jgi:hypothetical protein
MDHYFFFSSRDGREIPSEGNSCWGSMWEHINLSKRTQASRIIHPGSTLAISHDGLDFEDRTSGKLAEDVLLDLFEEVFKAYGEIRRFKNSSEYQRHIGLIQEDEEDDGYCFDDCLPNNICEVTFNVEIPVDLVVGLLQLIRTPIYLAEGEWSSAPKRPFAMAYDGIKALSHMGSIGPINALLAFNHAAYEMVDMFADIKDFESDFMLPAFDSDRNYMQLPVFVSADALRLYFIANSRFQIYPKFHDIAGGKCRLTGLVVKMIPYEEKGGKKFTSHYKEKLSKIIND